MADDMRSPYTLVERRSLARRAENRLKIIQWRKKDLLRQAGLCTTEWSYAELSRLRDDIVETLYQERLAIDNRDRYQGQLDVLSRP